VSRLAYNYERESRADGTVLQTWMHETIVQWNKGNYCSKSCRDLPTTMYGNHGQMTQCCRPGCTKPSYKGIDGNYCSMSCRDLPAAFVDSHQGSSSFTSLLGAKHGDMRSSASSLLRPQGFQERSTSRSRQVLRCWWADCGNKCRLYHSSDTTVCPVCSRYLVVAGVRTEDSVGHICLWCKQSEPSTAIGGMCPRCNVVCTNPSFKMMFEGYERVSSSFTSSGLHEPQKP